MKYTAHINVMPLKELLDPQGKAVTESMGNLGLSQISNVRIGKRISLSVEASNEEEAKTKVDEACKKLLVNQVMEMYDFSLEAQ